MSDHYEKSLICNAIQSSADAERCLAYDLEPHHFMGPVAAAVWAALPNMLRDGHQIVPDNIPHHVPTATALWINSLHHQPPCELNDESIAYVLRQTYEARRSDLLCAQAVQALNDGDKQQAIQLIHDSDQPAGNDNDTMCLGELYERRVPDDEQPISTGFGDLDVALRGGLKRGKIWIIGGRTSCRKTTTMLFSGYHLASNPKHQLKVGYLSLEDDDQLMAERMGLMMGLNPKHHREQIIRRLKELPFRFVHAPTATVDTVNQQAKRLLDTGIDILYVDYVQSIMPDSSITRFDLVIGGQLAGGMRLLASQYQVPIVLGSQVTDRHHAKKGEEEPPPKLGDLREAGSLSNVADVVTLHWKPVNTPAAEVHGYVAKCKWAPAELRFVLSTKWGMVNGLTSKDPAEPPAVPDPDTGERTIPEHRRSLRPSQPATSRLYSDALKKVH